MRNDKNWRKSLYIIIFEANTKAGKLFDIALIITILLSVAAVMLESITAVRKVYGTQLYIVEWIFTLIFTVEYILRLVTIGKPIRYVVSFFGIVDLLAIIPTYLDLLIPGTHFLLIIRVLRVLRVFRVLKLAPHLSEANLLIQALHSSRRKITVFLFSVVTMVIILGSFMYIIEGEEYGFTSIPRSVYWAIVTLTTVGYGDISPKTVAGQTLASFVMVLGYCIIAVPTGIVSVEISNAAKRKHHLVCSACSGEGHDHDADFCKFCGNKLPA